MVPSGFSFELGLGQPDWAQRTNRRQLAANELLARVVDLVDRLRLPSFSAQQICVHLNGLPLKYMQKRS
jgi:hypothetical protein